MSRAAPLAALGLLLALSACASVGGGMWPEPTLARAHAASDLDSYRVRRVALVPFGGEGLTPERARELASLLALELAPRVAFEIVQLSAADLAEVQRAEPHRRGSYASRTLLEISARFRVDAVLVGTVRDLCAYAPQRLAEQVELVSCETGQVAWAASVELDARDAKVLRAIESWHALERESHDAPGDEALATISPAVFARFAARELARSFE